MAVSKMQFWRHLLVASIPLIHAACPVAYQSGGICNHRGTCTSLGECRCDLSAFGHDCSQLRCPQGIAWTGDAYGVNQVHIPVECSNRGICDRDTGNCLCEKGFTGISCDKLECPNQCSKNGQCVSMSQLAVLRSPSELTYTNIWDAEKIYGCLCDRGSQGVDCSLYSCANGDDPMTPGQVNEIQLLKCTGSGRFYLKFEGEVSPAIRASTTSTELQAILQRIYSFGTVKVTYSYGTTICDLSGRNVVSIEFLSKFGPQPQILVITVRGGQSTLIDGNIVTASSGSAIGNVVSVQGTKEYAPCSSRGYCNPRNGQCSCYMYPMPGYRSSDGYGNVGLRGDCGAPDDQNFYGGPIKGCPGYLPCSGHGACSAPPSYTCKCALGWLSGDCSMRDCPKGPSWFSLPTSIDVAHRTWVTCSDAGLCDSVTGECECVEPFGGAACHMMKCPTGVGSSVDCSGHGICMNTNALAAATTIEGIPAGFSYATDPNNPNTWDGSMIHGCKCDIGFTGYDCSQRTCPTGDDPLTLNQVDEIQSIRCVADAGSFSISFRGATSEPIAFNAQVNTIQSIIQGIPTISEISISYSVSGAGACISGNIISFTFTQDFGNLPPLQVLDASLFLSGQSQMNQTIISEVQRGTKENSVCSNHGVCDSTTGICKCGLGYGSSDGYGQPGQRGDCGYVMPWIVVVS